MANTHSITVRYDGISTPAHLVQYQSNNDRRKRLIKDYILRSIIIIYRLINHNKNYLLKHIHAVAPGSNRYIITKNLHWSTSGKKTCVCVMKYFCMHNVVHVVHVTTWYNDFHQLSLLKSLLEKIYNVARE